MNKLDAALNFHQTALRVRNQRQELLASNIANADTPHYKARDLDFKAAMQSALQQSGSVGTRTAGNSAGTASAGGLQQTNSMHLSGSGGVGGGDPLFRSVLQSSVDGNTVDMDVERNAYVDNGIRYEASLNMISGQIKKMLSAISGQ